MSPRVDQRSQQNRSDYLTARDDSVPQLRWWGTIRQASRLRLGTGAGLGRARPRSRGLGWTGRHRDVVSVCVSSNTNGQLRVMLHADPSGQSNWYSGADLVIENGSRQVSTRSAGLGGGTGHWVAVAGECAETNTPLVLQRGLQRAAGVIGKACFVRPDGYAVCRR